LEVVHPVALLRVQLRGEAAGSLRSGSGPPHRPSGRRSSASPWRWPRPWLGPGRGRPRAKRARLHDSMLRPTFQASVAAARSRAGATARSRQRAACERARQQEADCERAQLQCRSDARRAISRALAKQRRHQQDDCKRGAAAAGGHGGARAGRRDLIVRKVTG
jgi:hypothetical protein